MDYKKNLDLALVVEKLLAARGIKYLEAKNIFVTLIAGHQIFSFRSVNPR
jgi:hypothetical protein